VISAYAVLSIQPELRLAVPLLVGVTACITMILATIFYNGASVKGLWSPAVILVVAVAVRFLFLFNPPQLSDDIYRYLWDGSNLLRGVNPYAVAPSAVKPLPESALIHSRINHPQYVTIYPPAAQLVFATGAALGGNVTGLKLFLILLDVSLCAILIKLLLHLGMPPWHSVLYAWNPLPVLEIAGSGHVDGAGLTMLFASICLLVTHRQNVSGNLPRKWPFFISGALLACACLVKLYPFAFIPVLLFLVPQGRLSHFFVGYMSAMAALLLMFMPHLVNMIASLETYARNWEFAGFAFTEIRSMSGSGTAARLLLSGSFIVAVVAISTRLAGCIRNVATTFRRECCVMNACYAIAMTQLLLTPTLQPWYALSLAVFLPFCAGPSGLILCWVVLLTYQVQISYFIMGTWAESAWVTAAVFLSPMMAFLLSKVCREFLPAAAAE